MTPQENYKFQKWRSVFRLLDRDHDGAITIGDYMEFPSRLLKSGKVDLATKLAVGYKKHWDLICNALDSRSGLISIQEDDWVKGHSSIAENEWWLREMVPTIASAYFDSMDENSDNFISIVEWRQYFHRKGMQDEKFIQDTFKKMDPNEDGYISRDEFCHAMLTFNTCHIPGEDYAFLYDNK